MRACTCTKLARICSTFIRPWKPGVPCGRRSTASGARQPRRSRPGPTGDGPCRVIPRVYSEGFLLTMKPLLMIVGFLAAVLIIAQLVMGLLILQGQASLRTAHQHSGYL